MNRLVSETRLLHEGERQRTLEQLEPLLMFLYPRKDADVKRTIAGTLLWRITNAGKFDPFKRTDGKFFCADWEFEINTFQVVKAELESSGVVKYGNGQYRISKQGLKKITNAFFELIPD